MSKIVFFFLLFSFFGWCFETAYCSVKNGELENRGFLYGPVCPIYGVGVLGVNIMHYFLGGDVSLLSYFFICAIGSAALEYVTSYVLERLFKARWWDYEDMPLNLNGRICLPASVLFGLFGVAIVSSGGRLVSFFDARVGYSFYENIAIFSFGIFCADLALTLNAAIDLRKKILAFRARLKEGVVSAGGVFVILENSVRVPAEELEAFAHRLGPMTRLAGKKLRSVRLFGDERGSRILARTLKKSFLKGLKAAAPRGKTEEKPAP